MIFRIQQASAVLCAALLLASCQAVPPEVTPLATAPHIVMADNEDVATQPPASAGTDITDADGTIALVLRNAEMPVGCMEIPYSIVNRTGEAAFVTLIPLLEKETADGWLTLPTQNVAFCGTPDTVADTQEGIAYLSWYEPLTAGRYRLSFNVSCIVTYDQREPLSAEFTLFDLIDLTASPAGASILLTNDSRVDYQYGEMYEVERYVPVVPESPRSPDFEWEPVETIIEYYAFHSIAYLLPAGESRETSVDWAWLYGELPPGVYRYKTHFSAANADETYTHYPVAVSFKISE